MTGYSDDDVSAEFQIKLIKKLLAEYPAAAFQEVVEEVRHLRLSGLQTTSPSSVDEGGVRQFQIQVQVKRWTPVERAQKSSEKVRSKRLKKVFNFNPVSMFCYRLNLFFTNLWNMLAFVICDQKFADIKVNCPSYHFYWSLQ